MCIILILFRVQFIHANHKLGALGWYNMEISGNGQGQHTIQVDLSGFTALPETCDLSGGLTYHIHSFWNDTSSKFSGANGECASSRNRKSL